ncbi:hypothetical protein [Celerinatantimonas sp. MCCC 1A17872]|uniref:hypothetical protein n=1 Tax=Celerinatantimonas sp. MCCC 1A17872 TaxID=3177514 RepID=UPI0038C061DC
MVKKILFLLILCSGTVASALADTLTYQGTLGNYPIMLSVSKYGSDWNNAADYLYTRYLKQTHLRLEKSGTGLTLYQYYSEPSEKKELFELHFVGKNLEGTWQNKQTKLPVKLKPTLQSIDDYQHQHLQFIVTGHQSFGQYHFDKIKETHSNMSFLRPGKGFSQAQLQFLAPQFKSLYMTYVMAALQCEDAGFWINDFHIVNGRYLSFSLGYDISCYGAHPEHGQEMYSYDLKTNQQLKKITDRFPGLQFFALLKAKYQGDKNLNEECDYFSDTEVWKYIHWRLTEKGVVIEPEYSHAMAPCEEEFSLSYSELKGHWQEPK